VAFFDLANFLVFLISFPISGSPKVFDILFQYDVSQIKKIGKCHAVKSNNNKISFLPGVNEAGMDEMWSSVHDKSQQY